jgi:hypothetical protein
MTLAEAQGMSPEAVIQKLFGDWLEYYRSPVWSSREGITAYEIGSIEQEETAQDRAAELGAENTVRVTFSVRPPAVGYSDWVAGNGEITPNGWVRELSLYAGLRQDGGRYWLVILGERP